MNQFINRIEGFTTFHQPLLSPRRSKTTIQENCTPWLTLKPGFKSLDQHKVRIIPLHRDMPRLPHQSEFRDACPKTGSTDFLVQLNRHRSRRRTFYGYTYIHCCTRIALSTLQFTPGRFRTWWPTRTIELLSTEKVGCHPRRMCRHVSLWCVSPGSHFSQTHTPSQDQLPQPMLSDLNPWSVTSDALNFKQRWVLAPMVWGSVSFLCSSPPSVKNLVAGLCSSGAASGLSFVLLWSLCEYECVTWLI